MLAGAFGRAVSVMQTIATCRPFRKKMQRGIDSTLGVVKGLAEGARGD
jgi:hypothetical protein